ncbi:hypothetical protein Pan44_27420 [Caulifigura coniformis]|uniref:Uncharacterized protein n=1 Tax=Caulifigura coniformis TaxID=2527983 RepID=A0A517SF40_9PLAN|nr:hypothetical protein [Caulifigura coniformis]QDT54707.1 hypothetical protein Pan44_27420 [Caulifigura coniformis]
MRTIPTTLAWEFLNRGRWWLPASMLAAILLPLLLFGEMHRRGAFQPSEPSLIMVQSIMMQIGMLMVGAAVFAALGPYARLFARPISTPGIVLLQLLPAGLISAAMWGACTLILNTLLPLDWPLLGPALFLAVILPAVVATYWYTDKSFWLIPSLAFVGVVLGIWFRSHLGMVFRPPTHFWREVTVGDFLFLLCIANLSGFVAVSGIARQRRQEPLPALHLERRLEWLLDQAHSGSAPFQSAERAMVWAERRRRGWILPALSFASMLVAFSLWLVFDRNPVTLLRLATGSGVTVAVTAGLISAFGCRLGPTEANWSIGPFLGTRPITSSTLARCMIAVQLRSVAIATALWLAAFLAAYAINEPYDRLQQPTWLIITLIVCPWISTAVGATIALTGRAQVFGAVIVAALVAVFSFGITVQLAAPRDLRQQILSVGFLGTVYLLSSATILGTILAFVVAKRRAMISSKTVMMAISVAVLLAAIGAWGLLQNSPPVAVGFLVAAAVALAVSPWATSPLAIAWNRSR